MIYYLRGSLGKIYPSTMHHASDKLYLDTTQYSSAYLLKPPANNYVNVDDVSWLLLAKICTSMFGSYRRRAEKIMDINLASR